jgi:hypothetical protein
VRAERILKHLHAKAGAARRGGMHLRHRAIRQLRHAAAGDQRIDLRGEVENVGLCWGHAALA